MTLDLPTFLSPATLATRAGIHRSTILRLQAAGVLLPDAFHAIGESSSVPQPLFRADRVPHVRRLLERDAPAAPAATSTDTARAL